jgi:hypothetical protein
MLHWSLHMWPTILVQTLWVKALFMRWGLGSWDFELIILILVDYVTLPLDVPVHVRVTLVHKDRKDKLQVSTSQFTKFILKCLNHVNRKWHYHRSQTIRVGLHYVLFNGYLANCAHYYSSFICEFFSLTTQNWRRKKSKIRESHEELVTHSVCYGI